MTVGIGCSALVSGGLAEEKAPAPTGCQLGAEVPSFFVREVTGERPNLATCLVCRYGARPVVMLCVRELDPQVERVLAAVDEAVDAGRGQGLRGFAIFLSSDVAATQPELMRLARREKISIPLTIPVESGGPRTLALPQEARLTVLCYTDRKIVARHFFDPGEISQERLAALKGEMKKLAD